MRLTQSQINKYEQNGYHLYGRLISDTETDRLGRIYLDCLEEYEAPHPSQGVRKIMHDTQGAGFYQLRCAHLMDAGFDALIRDEGLLDAVESLIGPNIRIIICQGLYKPPHSGDEIRWHQDDYYFQVNKANAARDKTAVKAMEAKGAKILPISEEVKQQWAKYLTKVPNVAAAEGDKYNLPMRKALKMYIKILKKDGNKKMDAYNLK